jgi:hypothetical protein
MTVAAGSRYVSVEWTGNGRSTMQIPWRGWCDIISRTYREMNTDRLLSVAGTCRAKKSEWVKDLCRWITVENPN